MSSPAESILVIFSISAPITTEHKAVNAGNEVVMHFPFQFGSEPTERRHDFRLPSAYAFSVLIQTKTYGGLEQQIPVRINRREQEADAPGLRNRTEAHGILSVLYQVNECTLRSLQTAGLPPWLVKCLICRHDSRYGKVPNHHCTNCGLWTQP